LLIAEPDQLQAEAFERARQHGIGLYA